MKTEHQVCKYFKNGIFQTVQNSNRALRAIPNITAVFVGGTSGIGQSTLRRLAQNSDSPTANIIDRSKSRAGTFLAGASEYKP